MRVLINLKSVNGKRLRDNGLHSLNTFRKQFLRIILFSFFFYEFPPLLDILFLFLHDHFSISIFQIFCFQLEIVSYNFLFAIWNCLTNCWSLKLCRNSHYICLLKCPWKAYVFNYVILVYSKAICEMATLFQSLYYMFMKKWLMPWENTL